MGWFGNNKSEESSRYRKFDFYCPICHEHEAVPGLYTGSYDNVKHTNSKYCKENRIDLNEENIGKIMKAKNWESTKEILYVVAVKNNSEALELSGNYADGYYVALHNNEGKLMNAEYSVQNVHGTEFETDPFEMTEMLLSFLKYGNNPRIVACQDVNKTREDYLNTKNDEVIWYPEEYDKKISAEKKGLISKLNDVKSIISMFDKSNGDDEDFMEVEKDAINEKFWEIEDEKSIKHLMDALKSKHWDTRMEVACKLGCMGVAEGIKILISENKKNEKPHNQYMASGGDYDHPYWMNSIYYKRTGYLLDKIPIEKVGELLEELKLYDDAEEWYTTKGMLEKAGEMKQKKADLNAPKISQKIVHGDEVTKTEIKDSVLNRSNIGAKSSKAEELREAKALLDDGIIDDDEFKQMKKEILGK
ncbi:SHOCT domain-containing protein [Marine Group III euryarchaeote]|nr:SHOCT domain-containing protein [Marine Group III euryarchaeote]